jgi:hypothetical protein
MVDCEIGISYSQIAAFDPAMDKPFNDWSDQHVAQGFAWRPGSVSFGTLESGGKAHVSVRLLVEESFQPKEDAARAIQVPFTVSLKNEVEIASIASGQRLEIPSGEYCLIFETGLRRDQMWCWFTFKKQVDAVPRILRADDELTPPEQFVMTAEPA